MRIEILMMIPALMLILPLPAFSQTINTKPVEYTAESVKKDDNAPKTLFGSDNFTYSGYGAPFYRISKTGRKAGHYAGARGGLIINDRIVAGLVFYGLAYPEKRNSISGQSYDGAFSDIHMGCGGFLYEYHFAPKEIIHFSLGTMIGGGNLVLLKKNDEYERRKKFFMIEPEAGMYLNVTRWFRVAAIASYRFTEGADLEEFRDKHFRGAGFSVAAEFGWF